MAEVAVGSGKKVTLNVDLGELPDEPAALYRLATQVNVACGGHAGDATSMTEACRGARAGGATLAAHPSYPDREGFGRRRIELGTEVLRASLAEQCAALRTIAAAEGLTLQTLKPHGALYHDVGDDDALARALVGAALDALGGQGVVTFVGAPGGRLAEACAREPSKARFVAEAFADRAYDGDRLRARGRPGALLTEPAAAAAQAVWLAKQGRFGTVCVHGDTPGAVAIATAVRAALEAEGLLA